MDDDFDTQLTLLLMHHEDGLNSTQFTVRRLKELFAENADKVLEKSHIFEGSHNRFFAVRELREAWEVPA